MWILTQLARWGYNHLSPEIGLKSLDRVRRPDLYSEACRQMDLPDLEPVRHNFALFDGMVFNPDDPIGYIERFTIRREYNVSEICIV